MSKIIAVLLLLSSVVQAEPSIRFGGFSTHLSDRGYNSFHRVLFIEKDTYFGGYFRNSYNEDSFAVGKQFIKHEGTVDLILNVGATYGYRKDSGCYKYQGMDNASDKIVCPMIAPEIRLNTTLNPSIVIFGNAFVLNAGWSF